MVNKSGTLATYKAISLLGRPSIDKLLDNGLVIVNAREYNNLKADLHAISAELEVVNKSQTQSFNSNTVKPSLEGLSDVATMTNEQINQELYSYGFTETLLALMDTEIKDMILNYIKSDKNINGRNTTPSNT